ncbi:MAG: NAD-dependent epimerase/dehydratase family protein [Acidobacteria bacterium]|nr:NAD-dependent epimerase/dehydratase family protein [Acidobacteriota bacterium]
MNYRGLNVLVTGGLGFIGSNLTLRLVELGAKVTIVDPILPGCGGNACNIDPVRESVRVIGADISDAAQFRDTIAASDVIFNLAGEISHLHSMHFPERDLQINTVAQLRFLLECKAAARGVRIVYAGTRQVYGKPRYLPVDEGHSIEPVDFNGVHKYAATQYHRMLTRTGDLDAYMLRLTNVYGPRMALDAVCQGFLSTYVRRLLLGQPLEIYGDGRQLRDPVYVDDVVQSFLIAGRAQGTISRSFNVGGPEALSLAELARLAASAAGAPEPVLRPFPDDRKNIDIGSYRTDNNRIGRELDWSPRVRFADGIRRTLDFYRERLPHYLPTGDVGPVCNMPEHSGAPRRLTYAEVARHS